MDLDRITVDKTDLRTKLVENREKHLTEYREARATYLTQVAEKLHEITAAWEAGDNNQKRLYEPYQMPVPSCYVESYDQAIQMLDWHLDDTVKLDQDTFRELVLDEWNWKQSFTATSSIYNSR